EFARNGFAGASTRAIAIRAGAHQPQINYHFSSKEALWRAVVDDLFNSFRRFRHVRGLGGWPHARGFAAQEIRGSR
ncbi:MAG: TetR/AcrR family transcriptional regulator, partial [Rhodobacteraceae bacterium]|nr:TetR/AcrR family transcriptional regulator [Paracoccaceae bacterium]